MSSTTVSVRQEELLRRARELGRRDAGDFIERLERRERREREKRLAELAWRPGRRGERWHDDGDASLRTLDLQARVRDLESYLHAVENSLVWRWTQKVRRWFGRAW